MEPERKQLICKECGSGTFELVTKQLISDAFSEGKDPIADRTIDTESIASLKCTKCGSLIVETFFKKPIPRNDWEGHWDEFISDYIEFFEMHVVNRDLEDEDDREEAYLRGMVKGMWVIRKLIKSVMVQDTYIKGRKTTYRMNRLPELLS